MPTRRLFMVAGMVLVAIGLSTAAVAQTMQDPQGLILNASYEFHTFSGLKDPVPGTFEEDASVFVNDFSVTAAWYDFELSPRTKIIPMFAYEVLDFSYDDFAPDTLGPDVFKPNQLYALRGGFALHAQLNDKWHFAGKALLGIVSDFREVDSDHWKLNGSALFVNRGNQQTIYGVGATFSRRFGEPFVLPLLKLRYQGTSNWYIDVLAPRYAEYWNMFREDVTLGFGIWFRGDEYERGKEVEGLPEFEPKGNSVRYSVGTVGPAAKYHLGNGWSVNGSLGLSFLRRYEVYNEETDTERDLELSEAFFVRFGIVSRWF